MQGNARGMQGECRGMPKQGLSLLKLYYYSSLISVIVMSFKYTGKSSLFDKITSLSSLLKVTFFRDKESLSRAGKIVKEDLLM